MSAGGDTSCDLGHGDRAYVKSDGRKHPVEFFGACEASLDEVLPNKRHFPLAADHADIGDERMDTCFKSLSVKLVPAGDQYNVCVISDRKVCNLLRDVSAQSRCPLGKKAGICKFAAVVHYGDIEADEVGLKRQRLADVASAGNQQKRLRNYRFDEHL